MPSALAVQVGKRVRQLRAAAGLGVEKLAHEIDISKGHLSKIEHGKVDPGIGTLEKIAHRFELEVVDLLIDPDSSPRHRLIDRSARCGKAQLERALESL